MMATSSQSLVYMDRVWLRNLVQDYSKFLFDRKTIFKFWYFRYSKGLLKSQSKRSLDIEKCVLI